MNFAMDLEELTEIIGCLCTFLTEPENPFCGRIVADYGTNVAVQLQSGTVEIYDRSDLLIFD